MCSRMTEQLIERQNWAGDPTSNRSDERSSFPAIPL